MPPRLRLIAGPNGSGKTTLTTSIREKLGEKFGIYINADEMERSLRENQTVNFRDYGVDVVDAAFRDFYESHPLFAKSPVGWELVDGLFILKEPLPEATYFPTLMADFIRENLLKNGASFAFETVMSDAGKIDLMRRAQELGYRTYLYYVCIEDPLVNVDRVADRVKSKGHNVPTERILDRYQRSLTHLLPAIRNSNRAFLYDNSGTAHIIVAEITDGSKIEFDLSFIPFWFEDYVLNKL